MTSMKFGVYEVETFLTNSHRLIVSFAGIGDVDSDDIPYEWYDSLVNWNNGINYVFIRDTSRSWYTNENGMAPLIQWLGNLISERNISNTIGFGLSMGGYGSLVVDSMLKFDLTVAISSRAYIGRECEFDQRLIELSERLANPEKMNVHNLFRDEGNYIFLYSIDDMDDMKHASRLYLTKPDNVSMFSTRGSHNIGHNEKKIRGLNRLLTWLFSDNCISQLDGFKPFTRDTAVIASMLENSTPPGTITSAMYNEYFQYINPVDLPEHALATCADRSLDSYIRSWITQGGLESDSILTRSRLHLCPIVTSCYLNIGSFSKNLTFGWSQPEEDGCWATGIWHFMEGSIVDGGDGPYGLKMEYRVYLPPNSHQTINFFDRNGIQLQSVHHENGRDSGNVLIPLGESRLFQILVQTPTPLMPSDFANSEDNRELSIFITSLAVIPARL